MLESPVPEISAYTEIEAVHAVDLPQRAPEAPADRPWRMLRVATGAIDAILMNENDCLKQDLPNNAVCSVENWDEERAMPGAVDVLIDGSLIIHGPSTKAVEIWASGAAAARGWFDDPERGRSREDRARGLWPKPDSQTFMSPKHLFGFDPADDGSVQFELEFVTLLRIEGFTPGNGPVLRLDLLDVQRKAWALEKKAKPEAGDPPLRALRPKSFIDAQARYIRLFALAVSRHAGSLRTRYDELPEALTKPKAITADPRGKEPQDNSPVNGAVLHACWLPATVRPARVASLSPIPSFYWSDNTPAPAHAMVSPVSVSRSMCARVRAKRPWFSSGEGERLGIVIWPPNLFENNVGNVRYDQVRTPPGDRAPIDLRNLPRDGSEILELQDADLGPGGPWVTRWGADPVRAQGGVQGWLLSKDNFPHVIMDAASLRGPSESHIKDALLIRDVLMPVPTDREVAESRAAQPPGGFMAVSLITYAPRFDPDQEIWYADIELNPCGAVYPFVRLGLVRYQPHAPRAVQVSEPITEWVQIMPARVLKAMAYLDAAENAVVITATVEGSSSPPGDNNGHPESSSAQAPRVYFTLIRRRREQGDEVPGSELICQGPKPTDPDCGSQCATWTARFSVGEDEYRAHLWSIFAEEVDRLRPASYPDEPRYCTLKDMDFVDTGPRFVARVSLDQLRIT